ncbi:MAG: phage portal protein [Xanthobacter sp.]
MLQRLAHLLPFQRKAPPSEAKGLAASDSGLLALLGLSSPTAAGVNVGPSSALAVPAVACAVRAISEAAACLDVQVMRREGGVSRPVPDHPAVSLLRGEVNDWTDGTTFLRDLVAQALLYDEGGMAWVNRVSGRVVEIIHYDQGSLNAERDPNGTGELTYRLRGTIIPPTEIIHLRAPFGRAPVSLAREAIGLALTLEKHAAKLFSGDARPSGLVSFKERMQPEEVIRSAQAFAAMLASTKSGGTAFLDNGATYIPLVLTSVDAQFAEMRAFAVLEIARAFRVPATMLQDLSRATWSNTEAMGREFLVFTLEPWLRALEGALTRALIAPEDRPHTRIVFDRDDLTRADMGVRASAYSSLIASGVLNPNEARAWENLPPREGGDEFGNPFTSTPDGAAAPQEDGGRPKEDEANGPA